MCIPCFGECCVEKRWSFQPCSTDSEVLYEIETPLTYYQVSKTILVLALVLDLAANLVLASVLAFVVAHKESG